MREYQIVETDNGVSIVVTSKNMRYPRVYRATDRAHADRYVEGCKEEDRIRAEKQKARRVEKSKLRGGIVNPYKVGDIVYNSWGYDQTNIDYYQVVKASARSVTMRTISASLSESDGCAPMSGHVTPDRDHFTGQPFTKTLQIYGHYGNEDMTVYIPARHGSISKWAEGSKQYCSWYA